MQMTKERALRPAPSKGQRSVQLRSLLYRRIPLVDIIAMGFDAKEAEEAYDRFEAKRSTREANEKKLKNPTRCKGCGAEVELKTIEHGFCMACNVRRTTNEEREGRRRV